LEEKLSTENEDATLAKDVIGLIENLENRVSIKNWNLFMEDFILSNSIYFLKFIFIYTFLDPN
jgi:hypothetical protein